MSSCRKLFGLLALGLILSLPALSRADETATILLQEKKNAELLQQVVEGQLRLQKALNELQEMKVTLQELRERVLALERTMGAMQKEQKRISLFPPQNGTIRLENRLGLPATFIVNDVPYRLQPNQTQDLVAVPAGTFTYEVLVDGFSSLQPRATRTLLPNAVYTIFTFLP